MPDPLRLFKLIFVMLALAAVGVVIVVTLQRTAGPEPETAFWNALERNLTEGGATCTINETVDNMSTKQVVNLDLASKVTARSVTTIKQAENSATTEEITTRGGTFVRYTAISTDKRSSSGTPLSFDRLLNIWGKSPADNGQPTVFGRTALGNCVVPLAALSDEKVRPLMTELQKGKIFETDFTTSSKQDLQGRPVLKYDVEVQPRAYVAFMKQVAEAYGLKDLDGIDTATFQTKSPQELVFYIDSKTSRLNRISYSGKQHSVDFSEYGKKPVVAAPKTSIPAAELQQALAETR